MTALNKGTNAMPAADLEALDAALADFDLDSLGEGSVVVEDDSVIEDLELDTGAADEFTEKIVEEKVVSTSAVLEDDELRELEIDIDRSEAYEAQSSTPIETVEKQEPDPKALKAARKPRVSGAVTRTPRDISSVASEIFVLSGDLSAMDQEAKDAAKVATLAKKPSQKKVAEKFENLFTALSVNKAPSTYVMMAFNLLDTKKSITSADIVNAYKTVGAKSPTEGYDEGTARSQSGQIMTLFATVGIADRVGQALALRADSLIAQRLRDLPKPV